MEGPKESMMNKRRNGRTAVHEAMGSLHDHAVGTASDVRDLGDAIKDVLIEKLSEMLKRAMSFGERGKEAAADVARDVGGRIEERIQRHPYQSLLIAGGAGLLFGLLLRRR
jgi:ElaB/YqjD/DUF883 family membrane-anchored ribosome-binding protein